MQPLLKHVRRVVAAVHFGPAGRRIRGGDPRPKAEEPLAHGCSCMPQAAPGVLPLRAPPLLLLLLSERLQELSLLLAPGVHQAAVRSQQARRLGAALTRGHGRARVVDAIASRREHAWLAEACTVPARRGAAAHMQLDVHAC